MDLKMPTIQKQDGTYSRPFHVVTASIWDKYEGHAWIKEVEVIDRHIDASGCLRSRRLLTMCGKIPLIFRPFFGTSKPFYLLEDVTIDMNSMRMEVKSFLLIPSFEQAESALQVLTTNVNFMSLIDCRSRSSYVPDPSNSKRTVYDFAVTTLAFPGNDKDVATGRFQLHGLSRKIEEFVGFWL